MDAMDARELRRERTQNLWVSLQRKLPPLAKAATLDAESEVPFERIGGLAAAKDELLTYACAATHPEVYDRWGTFPPSALLLLGQRGAGKTLLAHALATRTESGFLSISVPHLVVELLRSGGRLSEWTPTFTQSLAEMPPVTVLFNELEFTQTEEMGGRRSDLPQGPVMDFLLEFIDQTIAVKTTLVVGATSHPETLRQAFVMPGRFERIVEVNPVFPDDIVMALQIHAADAEKRAGHPLFDAVDWAAVVRQYREPAPGDWVRLMHATLRRKARCEAAGEPVKLATTQDLMDEVDRARKARTRLPSAGGGIYL
ncbi:MAG TPA: ATP-binding protein [Myxococcota bacterium]|nr:ATP-binding protein [Myxococcota bacterium]